MFNAPDDTSPWDTLPVGHFVTRAFSYMMANTLPPGQTVADKPNMGYPRRVQHLKFLQSLGPNMKPGHRRPAAGLRRRPSPRCPSRNRSSSRTARRRRSRTRSGSTPISSPAGSRKENGSVLNAARAALADGSGDYLAWFAQRLAIQQSADLVVMGHTHTPIGGLTISPINYYNSGFECASIPDNPPKLFTFTIVDLETAAAEIMMVNHGDYAISVAPVPALPSVVLPPAMDFSCYVRILNQGSAAAHAHPARAPPRATGSSRRRRRFRPGAAETGGCRTTAARTAARARSPTARAARRCSSASAARPAGRRNTASGAGRQLRRTFRLRRLGVCGARSRPPATRCRCIFTVGRLMMTEPLDADLSTRARRCTALGSCTTPPRTSSTRAWTRCSGTSATRMATTPRRLG